MKIIIVSDIHGAFPPIYRVIEALLQTKADKLFLLGDILYHGPRNDLPLGYSPKDVFALLNKYSDKIVAVKGNCDAEVDRCVLDFDITQKFIEIEVDGKKWLLTHGDDEKIISQTDKFDVILSGHTHVKTREFKNGCLMINPGSVSIPKDSLAPGYTLYESGKFTFFDLEGNLLFEEKLG